MFHMGTNDAIARLRNSYSVISDISTFLQNLKWSVLTDQEVQAGRAHATLLRLMEHRPDAQE